jgi:hypothetical protein
LFPLIGGPSTLFVKLLVLFRVSWPKRFETGKVVFRKFIAVLPWKFNSNREQWIIGQGGKIIDNPDSRRRDDRYSLGGLS